MTESCGGRDCGRDYCSSCRMMRVYYSRMELADDPAGLLRLAASGLRDYAERAPERQRDVLEQEALTFEQAARIVEGDLSGLRNALPSWRWDEIPESAPEAS